MTINLDYSNKNCQISTKLLTSNLSIIYTINVINYMNKKIDIDTCMEYLFGY